MFLKGKISSARCLLLVIRLLVLFFPGRAFVLPVVIAGIAFASLPVMVQRHESDLSSSLPSLIHVQTL
jgi:hypothetical protein